MSDTAQAMAAAWSNLPDYLGQHVLLSISAIVLGLLISLPLAIAASRFAALRGPALGLASIIQTIPSLALLALFYPLLLALSGFIHLHFGFGFRALGFLPALLALTLYSMLPIVRNTITALAGIDPAAKTAARAVGMTPRQSLFLVELPLAAPVIMAGIRTAAVWVIGTATLSTPIGQTSLGNYIFTGLQTENWISVLFGCVAAGLLAIAVDRLLALAESGFALRSRARLIAAFVGIVTIVAAALAPLIGRPQSTITIGIKNFEEQYILGAVIKDHLARAGIATAKREGLGSTVLFHALSAGDIDIAVDYSGTLWANELKRADNPGRTAMLREISNTLKQRNGISMIGALGFENAYALAMRRDHADVLGIHSIADLALHARQMAIGGDYEFFARPEWRSVVKAYNIVFAKQRVYQPTFMYRALLSGDVDVIAAFSSDGRIAQYDLELLDDNKQALPPYDALLLVTAAHARDDRMLAALKPLLGVIDLKIMQRANLMVDRDTDKKTPEQAAQWLESQIRH